MSVDPKRSNGMILSVNESGPVFKTLDDRGCIVIADKGVISRLSQSSDEGTRCMWTVRASRKLKVTFKFLFYGGRRNDKDTFITLYPVGAAVKGTGHVVMSGSPSEKYTVDGPVVFVSMFTRDHSTAPAFRLSFEGQGEDAESLMSKYFVHYHTDLSSGELNYPEVRNAKIYKPNEVSTFTINPKVSGEMKPTLVDVDIEYDLECEKDRLMTYFAHPDAYGAYRQVDNNGYSWREGDCGNYVYQGGRLGRSLLTEDSEETTDNPFFLVFLSNKKVEKTGFHFKW